MRTQALFGIIAVVLRAATLIFQSMLIGGIVFHRWIAPDNAAQTRRSPLGVQLVRLSAFLLAGTQLLYLGIDTALLMDSLGVGLAIIVTANFFLAGVAMIIASVAIAASSPCRLARPGNLVVLLSAAVLGCGVLGSHAVSRMQDRVFLASCTAVHQCAAAIWIGGLPQLWISMRGSKAAQVFTVARRFSRFALSSVVALLASGLLLALRYVDSPTAIYGTSYGIMLTVKIFFFAVLLSIGAFNRMLLRSPSGKDTRLLLRRVLEAEIGIGITAILAATSLTSQPPAVDLKLGRVSAEEIYQRMKPAWPKFRSPGSAAVSASTLQAEKQAQRAGLPPPPVHANTPGDIAWSEYNHHWAGVFVLLVGLLGALGETRAFRRIKCWPLVLVGLAAFIFLRADPEGWPLGPDNFWESIQDGEVLQHKAFAMLIVLFAIFELRVQMGKAHKYAAYVFPAVCALGGALLLTHSHALDNVKEQVLAELSHAPIAVAAVLAGWSRWLQVRLPANEGGFAARVWPACFIVIGAMLLNYREA